MICAVCTGKHHAMACPSNAGTLLSIGVQPWPLASRPRLVAADESARPWMAVRARASLVENVLAASGYARPPHLRLVPELREAG